MKEAMINDVNLVRAVSRVLQRSEKQEDIQKLLGTFVDVGILPFLDNDNSQILYGRRGTGKTHVLKVLGSRIAKNEKNTVVYIDSRILGSTAQFSDSTVPLKKRCLSLFRDFLAPIQNKLMEHILECPNKDAERAFEAADNLAGLIVEPFKLYEEKTLMTADIAKNLSGIKAKVSTAVSNPLSLEMGAESLQSGEHTVQRTYSVENEDKVVFPALYESLSKILELADTKLFILLDEWSSLPLDIQPYFAEFIKRGLFPVQRIVIKIASLEYRSRFSKLDGEHALGFELGADISTATDLDDYYVYDRNPLAITDIYAEMLFRHLSVDLEEKYMQQHYRIKNGNDFASRLFTEKAIFQELSRASEGVVRDLINIFTLAFFNAHRRGRINIDRKAVLESARQWFEQDKAQQLDDHMQLILRRIVDEVIGNRRAK